MVSNSYILGICEEGGAELWWPGGTEQVVTGALTLFAPGQVARVTRWFGSRVRYRSMIVEPATMARALEAVGAVGTRGKLPLRRTALLPDAELLPRAQIFYATLEAGAHGPELRTAFFDLIAALSRSLDRERPSQGELEPHGVRRARDYLRANAGQPVRLDDLADLSGTSKFHLVRSFSATVGMPPHRYHLRLRLSHARELLGAGHPPAEVAVDLGFSDQSHFSRQFQRAFGVPPGVYRGSMQP
jgi:AraC-like DNA-binding protein